MTEAELRTALVRSLFHFHRRKAGPMSLFKKATCGSHAKVALLGFPGGGKTHTAVEIALGTRKLFKLEGPIAMFDTEKGSEYVESWVRKETGQDLIVVKSRSLSDLMTSAKEVEAMGNAIFIIDSITHVWDEVTSSYLSAKQKMQEEHNRRVSDKLEFQDWSRIKGKWKQWPDWYLNSPVHAIVCGRAGWEYDMQEGEDGKRNELVKTGIKMRAEGTFGYEPSLVIEMSREFRTDRRGQMIDSREVLNRATVLKDRFGDIDGRTCENPTFDFFRPHIARLLPSGHSTIDTDSKTTFELDAGGRDDWSKEKHRRTVFSEEIQEALYTVWPSVNGGKDKQGRSQAMRTFWGTPSWTALSEDTRSEKLADGLERFMEKYAECFKQEDPAPAEEKPAEVAGPAA